MKKDMRSLKNFKTLNASSVVESIIAISIISVCALVAFLIYLNVIKQNKSINYLNAKHKISLLTQQSILENDFEDNQYSFKNYTIDKKVTINKTEHTSFLTFTLNIGSKTTVFNKLISYNEE